MKNGIIFENSILDIANSCSIKQLKMIMAKYVVVCNNKTTD